MIILKPTDRIFVALSPVDFRGGIDSFACLLKNNFNEDPFSGKYFIFRNRIGTSLKILVYDGQGFWLMQKRFSEGKIKWWHDSFEEANRLDYRSIFLLLFNGYSQEIIFKKNWKKV